jgi:WhiB family redox-sensing transcriptional regulator
MRVSAEWRSRSACRDQDPELFFPAQGSLAVFVQLARAKAICGRCPVARECLRYALATGQHGVWGGTSEDERRAMRRLLPVGETALAG